jgi:hypothetical protein
LGESDLRAVSQPFQHCLVDCVPKDTEINQTGWAVEWKGALTVVEGIRVVLPSS